jgi:hypothetical protein
MCKSQVIPVDGGRLVGLDGVGKGLAGDPIIPRCHELSAKRGPVRLEALGRRAASHGDVVHKMSVFLLIAVSEYGCVQKVNARPLGVGGVIRRMRVIELQQWN